MGLKMMDNQNMTVLRISGY